MRTIRIWCDIGLPRGYRLKAGSRLLWMLDRALEGVPARCSEAPRELTNSTKQVCALFVALRVKTRKAHTTYVMFAPRLGILASFRRLIGWYLFVVVVLGCCGRFRLLPRLLMRALLVASCVRQKKLFFLACYVVPSLLRSSLHEFLIHRDSISLLY